MNYDKLLEKGRDLNNDGKFLDAIKLFESIEEHCKDDIKWAYRYAYALIYTNQFKKALDILEEKLLNKDYDYPNGYILLGQLYYWQGKKVDAFKTIKKGWSKAKKYAPDVVWEFEQTARSMYYEQPFANPDDWSDSVLANVFENYDENADSQYKVQYTLQAKHELDVYFGDYERETVPATLFINGRLQPKHRWNYEDYLSFYLAMEHLGKVDGGGTFTSEDNRITGCDIHFDIYADEKNYSKRFVKLIKDNINLPKGSYIEIGTVQNKERMSVGKYAVLAIGLDAQNLPDEVYEKYSVGDLLQTIEETFIANGKFLEYFYYDVTDERTYLRFLVNSYKEAEQAIQKEFANHPLCQNAVFINETNLNG